MQRALHAIGIVVLTLMPMFAVWVLLGGPAAQAVLPLFHEMMESALVNPLDDFRDGASEPGAVVSREPATGLPMVRAVSRDSVFARAGVRTGDIITEINGLATTNQSLAQIGETIQGFTTEKVALTIQRIGSTNRECILQ
jgi:S1-C subfamily serine protease